MLQNFVAIQSTSHKVLTQRTIWRIRCIDGDEWRRTDISGRNWTKPDETRMKVQWNDNRCRTECWRTLDGMVMDVERNNGTERWNKTNYDCDKLRRRLHQWWHCRAICVSELYGDDVQQRRNFFLFFFILCFCVFYILFFFFFFQSCYKSYSLHDCKLKNT